MIYLQVKIIIRSMVSFSMNFNISFYSTQKSKLLEILKFENSDNENQDLISQYRCLSTNPPNIFEELIKRFLFQLDIYEWI